MNVLVSLTIRADSVTADVLANDSAQKTLVNVDSLDPALRFDGFFETRCGGAFDCVAVNNGSSAEFSEGTTKTNPKICFSEIRTVQMIKTLTVKRVSNLKQTPDVLTSLFVVLLKLERISLIIAVDFEKN